MTRPRKEIVCVENTPYYHITSRCVRRAFLCGFDQATQTNYEYRRHWIEARIRLLSSLFAIDVCAYAVMSNHYHIVLRLDPGQATSWTEQEVMQRWLSLFKGTLLVQRFHAGKPLTKTEMQTLKETLSTYKKRLTDLSWFMKCLNEPIARRANKEDQTKGHFWEARYKSLALLSEVALITCMAYVDLNPIRSGLADRPERSDHTSIKERLTQRFDLDTAIKDQIHSGHLRYFRTPLKPLLRFSGLINSQTDVMIPIPFTEYIKLLDWTGRVVRNDKVGAIPSNLDHILCRINISKNIWLANATQFESLQTRTSATKQSKG